MIDNNQLRQYQETLRSMAIELDLICNDIDRIIGPADDDNNNDEDPAPRSEKLKAMLQALKKHDNGVSAEIIEVDFSQSRNILK